MKSLPITNFEFFDNFGRTISSVAPGYTVLSRHINFSLIEYLDIFSATATIYDMSGSLVLFSGVGTQIIITSDSDIES